MPLKLFPLTRKRQGYLLTGVILAAIICIGGWFRYYPFWQDSHRKTAAYEKAVAIVITAVEKQIQSQEPDLVKPGLSDQKKKALLRERVGQAIREQKSEFETTVQHLKESLEKSEEKKEKTFQGHYLLESDPYYYYSLAKRIAQKGSIAEKFENGRFFNPLRSAPFGSWDQMNLHPYLGYAWFRLLSHVSDMDLMSALCSYPILLYVIAVVAFFILTGFFSENMFARLSGCFLFTMSPMFIQRSNYGWYDTDPYHYLILILNFIFFFQGIQSSSGKRLLYAVIGGITTALYSLFWLGWLFALYMVIGMALTGWIASRTFLRSDVNLGYYRYAWIYVLSAVAGAIIFMTPGGFYEMTMIQMGMLPRFTKAGGTVGLWPNYFVTVGEMGATSLPRLIMLNGSPIAWLFWGIGVYCVFRFCICRRGLPMLSRYAVLALFMLAVLAASLRVERLVNFFVVPFAIFAMIGVDQTRKLLASRSEKIKFFTKKPDIYRFINGVIIALILFAPAIFHASLVVSGLKPIMDDTWYGALIKIKEEAEPDAIVHSWWPPGYFIQALSERRTVLDGGSFENRQNYWISKALLSGDEFQSVSLIRMLNVSGSEVLVFLQDRGFSTSEAVRFVLEYAQIRNEEGRPAESKRLSEEDFLAFQKLMRGVEKHPVPTYVLIHDDMIKNSVILSVSENWDFDRVEAIQNWSRLSGKFLDYKQIMFIMNSRTWKYTPEAVMVDKRDDALTFSNGLQVNLSTMDSYATFAAGGTASGKPISLFYLKDNILVEKSYEEKEKIDVSALLMEQDGNYTSLLADRNMIRSLLYQLYFLRGKALHFLKPFYQKDNPMTGTSVYIFKIDWDRFYAASAD